MDATVKTESFLSSTTYTITGDALSVRAAVDDIMRRYHPLGYGTMAKYTETGAVVTRANSCD